MTLLSNHTVRLRALEPEDLDLLYKWENDSSLWLVGTTLSPYSRFVLKEYIAESHRDLYEIRQLRLMIEHNVTHQTIGMIDLYDFDPHHQRAGVGILIGSDFQRKGYATEALETFIHYAFGYLKLHQLYAHIPVANEASKRLFLRCGFSESGRLSDWLSTPNGYEDVLVVQRIQFK